MRYTVRTVGSHYVVIKNKQRLFSGSYDGVIRFLKAEHKRLNKLGLEFSLTCRSMPWIEEDVYSYTY